MLNAGDPVLGGPCLRSGGGSRDGSWLWGGRCEAGLTVKSQVEPTNALTREERSIRVRPESRKPAESGQRSQAPLGGHPLTPNEAPPSPSHLPGRGSCGAGRRGR